MPETRRDSVSVALRKFLERADLTQDEVARAAGYAYASGVQRFLSQEYKQPFLPQKVVDKLAPVLVNKGDPPITALEFYEKLTGLGVPAYMTDRLRLPPETLIPNAERAVGIKMVAMEQLPQDIPLLGVAAAGTSGDFTLNGEVVDHIKRPPGIARRQHVFAIYAIGDSMAPWRQPGDPVYVDEVRPPREGDYVVVECHEEAGSPGPAYLKRLVSVCNDKVRLAQFNPPEDRIEIPRARIKRIYRVIDWPELLGLSR